MHEYYTYTHLKSIKLCLRVRRRRVARILARDALRVIRFVENYR